MAGDAHSPGITLRSKFLPYAPIVALAAVAVGVLAGTSHFREEERKNIEPLLIAEMKSAIAKDQSYILLGKVHVFLVAKEDSILGGVFSPGLNKFCWGADMNKNVKDCFALKDASSEFTLEMMRGACETAIKTEDVVYRKKYCPRFTV